eukprot:SAG22_NODE_2708_length_2293_cov_1.318140_2_plen_176_part_00
MPGTACTNFAPIAMPPAAGKKSAGRGAQTKNLRVLLHTGSWKHCDGVSIRYHAHAAELVKGGHQLYLSTAREELAEDDDFGLLPALLMGHGVRAPCSDGPNLALPTLGNMFRIIAFMARNEIDVVHATFDPVSTMFLLAAQIFGVPVVVSLRPPRVSCRADASAAPAVAAPCGAG